MAAASSSNLRLQQISVEQSSEQQSEFVAFRATMRLPIAPVWAADGSAGGALGTGGMEGVKEVLASWVMRYLPPLRAVLLTFDPLPTFAHQTESFPASKSPFSRRRNGNRMLESDGEESDEEEQAEQTNGQEKEVKKVQLKVLPMIEGSGFGLANVEFKGMAWRPRVGQTIVGSPTLSTPSHISLLLHNLFNASIPASHIPSDTYHFDPDFPVPEAIQNRQKLSFPTAAVPVAEEQPAAAVEEKAEVDDEEQRAELEDREVGVEIEEEVKEEEEVDEEAQEEEAYRERGWWRHNVTNEPLGGAEGRIEFTIVGITVANSMISLTGSLLPDPFSPAANAATTSAVAPKMKKLAAAKAAKAEKAAKASSKKRARHESESDAGDDSDDSVSSRSPSPPAVHEPPKVEPDVDSESEAEVVQPKAKKARKDKGSSTTKKEKKSGSKEKKSKSRSKKE